VKRGIFRCARILPGLATVLVVGLVSAPPAAAASPGSVVMPMSTGGVVVKTDLTPQNASRLAMKRQGLLRYNRTTRQVEVASASTTASFQASAVMAAAVTSGNIATDADAIASFIEPLGGNVSLSEKDDAGHHYNDQNFWGFCVDGAGAVAADTFTMPMDSYFTGSYTEPWGAHIETTYWTGSDTDAWGGFATKGRSYMLYLADKVQPQNPQSANFNSYVWDVKTNKYDILKNTPGIMDYRTYPKTGGSNLAVLTDALNWGASWENRFGPWPGYFFDHVTSFSQALLHADVVNDITNNYEAVVVSLDAQQLLYNLTTGLGNWGSTGKDAKGNPIVVGHAISIVGFDDTKGTYQYVDTCGARCSGGPFNGGVHSIRQTTLYNAVHAFGGGYIA
jgi:hypothetical protein